LKRFIKIIGFVILGIVVISVIGSVAGGGKNSPSQTSQGGKTEATTHPVEPTIVDATTLVGEYDKNKLSADEKYKGKLVQTTGYISNISGGDLGDYYLVLKPKNDQYYFGTNIQAFFKDKSMLTSLSNGDKVTIQGTLGEMSIGQVIMKDCSVVK
jgi:hypothetical protein